MLGNRTRDHLSLLHGINHWAKVRAGSESYGNPGLATVEGVLRDENGGWCRGKPSQPWLLLSAQPPLLLVSSAPSRLLRSSSSSISTLALSASSSLYFARSLVSSPLLYSSSLSLRRDIELRL
ncbi:hypothetical protein ISN44_As09g004590 [Arabidopsis suecica]|uniref:Uncharacterized protein n=1 Tax=Arabidopsis suecica TaxID=45249 RepID=A0A8T2ACS6_ARASU|nr:hypothetical protein ISN44_As09g004590 [Arabidopsis suecica]KAG7572062.1 hypothetical protein ISN44_As09g004590 [Arabidopsis suecica]KAG7572063.1 hypothetical protein ISN44_As09g004590 [Arabidopsis suecica]